GFPAPSWTTSPTSFAATSGICTFLMISSRPQTAIAQPVPLSPARETARRMASTTIVGSLMVPSVMASGGRGATPREVSVWAPPDSLTWTAFTPLDPMSRPKISGDLRKNAILNPFLPVGYVVEDAAPRGGQYFPIYYIRGLRDPRPPDHGTL